MSDERAVLEAIAYGDEAGFSERLRALEMLRTLDRGAAASEFFGDLDGVPESELDRNLDALLVADAVRAVLIGEPVMGLDPADFPATAAVLQDELGRRLAEQAASLEAEYEGALARLARPEAEPVEEEAETISGDEPQRLLRVVPPEGIDPRAGWPKPRAGRVPMTLNGRRHDLT